MLPNKKTSSVPVLVSGDATAAASLSARSAAPPLCSVRPQLLSDGGKLLHKAPSMSSAATRLKGQFPLKNVKAMQHRDKDRDYWPDVCWGVTQGRTEPNYRAGNDSLCFIIMMWDNKSESALQGLCSKALQEAVHMSWLQVKVFPVSPHLNNHLSCFWEAQTLDTMIYIFIYLCVCSYEASLVHTHLSCY